MKRAMEVMVWFYENFNNFSPLIQDEHGDGDDGQKDHNGGVESKNREELKDERPYIQKLIIEDELFPREDEPPAVQKESSPFLKDWRPASLTEESRPPKKEQVFFEEAEFFSKERPAVRREQLAFKEGRPTIKEERSPLENLPSVSKEERSTLKEKRRIRKARSPSKTGRSTIKEEPSTLEKEGPTRLEAILGRFHFAGPVEPIPPVDPDLLLPEEIVGAPSQVKHLFSTDSRLNK